MATAPAPSASGATPPPHVVYACDMCGDCPVQDVAYRCTACHTWALCGPCHTLAQRGVSGRAAASAAIGWHDGGPCGVCGSTHSALWRRGSGRETPWVCQACVVLGDAGDDTYVVEDHDARRHTLQRVAVPPSSAAEALHTGRLSSVVNNAVQRWFCETLRSAKQGDANMMELLSQMFAEGYGCQANGEEAKHWHALAREHGARRLEGVYDELP